MNSRTLFEVIGTADEEMLAHSERTVPVKPPFRVRKAFVLLAAALAALAVTAAAAASGENVNVLSWIAGAFAQSGSDYVPNQNVLQAQLKEGQWFYLNGENVAMIVPESPVKIMLSDDGGTTWKESVVQGSDKMEFWGDLQDEVQYYGGFIGFFGECGGYLVLTAGVAMNNQPMRIYLTGDRGNSWREIGNPYDQHASVLTGAAFSTPKIGFISYRYYEDAGPDIWRTTDGGDTWNKLPVTLPEEYTAETYRFTPQSPVFDGPNGVYPIIAANHDAGTSGMIYMRSGDYGLTWRFD